MQISPLHPEDRAAWEVLARSYKAFYQAPTTDAEYTAAWERLMHQHAIFGLGAKIDGELVGITHFLFHSSTWAPKVCYLQDLFTAPEMRSKGVARGLIETAAAIAREQGAARFYWLTRENNTVARSLYDKIGKYHGFIRYEIAMG